MFLAGSGANLLTMNTPRVLLLSLARAAERRRISVDQLHSEKINFEIIEAVDGLGADLPQKTPGQLRNGEVGCYMTHLRAYERMVAYDWPHAVILEDDFFLIRSHQLASALDGVPSGWACLILHQFRFGDGGDLRVVERAEKFNRLQPCGVCTHGQVVSRRLAEYMLGAHALPAKPIDITLREVSKDPGFPFYELAAALVGVRGGPSFINPSVT